MNKLMDEVGEIQEILDHGGFYTIDVKIKDYNELISHLLNDK